MKDKFNRYLFTASAMVLLALLPSTSAAKAADSEPFALQQGAMDTVPEAINETPRLSGQVTQHHQEPDAEQVQEINLPAGTTVNLMDILRGASGKSGIRITFGRSKPAIDREALRRLKYGVIGLKMVSFANRPFPVISEVYPTCPAANAGILPGDLLYRANGYTFQCGDDQRVLWKVATGIADTPIDVSVIRAGKRLDFTLTRMNIEDIEDKKIRGGYEFLLWSLGGLPDQQKLEHSN